ncbi:hypothetical protein [Vannielia litorea]|uniref:Uncharacterized protein n=1 Tax=Vannielia litorea TaxID=1217970 RepID=A0A1N6GQN3_9RHOB|nr:hypothetical protein [Vannielia litorea]SIO09834.1 hypothetical protein SAMN05444002_2695 [Vannielia litorea]
MPGQVASLLPLVGALLVIFKGIARLRAKRAREPYTPPQPRDVPAPPRPPARSEPLLPDAACRLCAAPIPASESICPLCARKTAAPARQGRSTLLHWVVFIAIMTTIIGLGALVAP